MINSMFDVREASSGLDISDQHRPIVRQTETEREAGLLLKAYVGVWLTIAVSLLAIAALAVVGIGVLVSWLLP
jgi:hypothetical protein